MEGQVSKLRLCYARERSAPTGAAADALEVRGPVTVTNLTPGQLMRMQV